MANLKQLRKRIRSVTNTQQITKAMKMVAAAKLRRAQERAQAARSYSALMEQMVRALAEQNDSPESAHPLLAGRGNGQQGPRRVELVVCTADRGLCGSFNSGVVRAVRQQTAELVRSGATVTYTCIGRKGADVLKRQYGDAVRRVHAGLGRRLSPERLEEEVAAPLIADFLAGRFDVCLLVFNTFKSAMSQILTWKQIVPVATTREEQPSGASGLLVASYLFEPDVEALQEALLPKNVAVQLYQAVVESEASEHGARMTAMDNAVRNARDMARKLTIAYNRSRQAVITKELLEIIGGAESLKG